LDILNLWFWLPKALVCNEEEHGIDTYKYWFSKVGLWDLLSCIKGEFLPHDWDWKPWPENHARAKKKGRIMGKYVLPIIQVVADTEHHANHLGLKHWGCLDPCDFCPADSRKGSRMPWSDFGDSSLWMALCVTLLQWMANPTQHPLWENYILLGITIFCICFDELHVMALGVLQYFMGSVIWTLVHESGLPGNFGARADHVYNLLCDAYKEQGTARREKIDRAEFMAVFGRQTGPKPGEYPELSSKAARTRHTVPALLRVCEVLHRTQALTKPEHVKRLECLRNLVRWYAILESSGHVLSPDRAEEIIKVTDAFLRGQNEIAMIYWDMKVKLFKVTFKSHLLWHMARQCKYCNPRHAWAYRDESFVGSVAKVVKSVACGGGAWACSDAFAKKWRRLMWFRLRRRQGAVFA